jgi:hypothetical protein
MLTNKNFIKTDYQLKVFEPNGHLDVFMGDKVHVDTLPTMLNFMLKHQKD